MIRGKHVRLRPFEKTDLEACRKWVNDPEVAKGLMRVLPVSMHEHEQWYERIISDTKRVTFAIETVKGSKYIGNIGLMNIDWKNSKGMLWIYTDKSFWDKGLGKEAVSLLLAYSFENLNLHKVYLEVAEYNQRAVRMYTSIGFKDEGVLREDVYIDSRYVNVLRMSVLRGEAAGR